MTSLLRRKRRTTAPRTTRPATAARFAVLVALVAAVTADAQQPGRQPPVPQQANGLYPPPGYRQRTPVPQPTPPVERAMDGGGRVMYFHKPADALMSAEPDAGGVALAASSDPVLPPGVTDVPISVPSPALLSAPRAVPAIPTAAPVVPTPSALPVSRPTTKTNTNPQPGSPPAAAFPPHIAQRQPVESSLRDPEVTKLPERDKILRMYNDAELEKLIARAVRDEHIQRKMKNDKKSFEEVEKATDPLDHPTWRMPRLTPIVPPGTVYKPKTVGYEPRVAPFEPSYVVHRRLHFEEKNTERYGWDLGIIQPVVSTMYFYKDTLLWPNSLVSGCVHGFWDTSAGKCQPGSPVPYYLYPPGLTITGTAAEAGLITGISFIIP